MATENETPAGYRRNARDHLIPESQIKAIDRTRDELVQELVADAKRVNESLRKFKSKAFNDVAAFVSLSAEQYGVHLGGKKGNVALLSFDGQYKVQRAIAENITFDERLQAAKELIDACLKEWTEDARPELRTLISDAFRVDSAGNVRTQNVLGLGRLEIDDERWKRAMQAISDAIQVVGTNVYFRVYERDARGQYQAIGLDLATVSP